MMKMKIKAVEEDMKDGNEEDDNDDGDIIEVGNEDNGGDEDDQSAWAALEAEIKHMEMTLRSHANGSADQGVGGTRVFYQTHRERGHCQGGGVRGGENHR